MHFKFSSGWITNSEKKLFYEMCITPPPLPQDVELKVTILEFIAECVSSQPGMMELFLKVQPVPADSAVPDKVRHSR